VALTAVRSQQLVGLCQVRGWVGCGMSFPQV
jgi:hypothetical protein